MSVGLTLNGGTLVAQNRDERRDNMVAETANDKTLAETPIKSCTVRSASCCLANSYFHGA
jgi:hypothetical protein